MEDNVEIVIHDLTLKLSTVMFYCKFDCKSIQVSGQHCRLLREERGPGSNVYKWLIRFR